MARQISVFAPRNVLHTTQLKENFAGNLGDKKSIGNAGRTRTSGLPDGYSQIFRSQVFGPSGFWTMAPLRYAAKFDPFLSLDCARVEGVGAQSKERKGSNFAAEP